MMNFRSFTKTLAQIAMLLLVATIGLVSASANDLAKWSFDEFRDTDNKGRKTARLKLAVPETDLVQLIGTCTAASSTSTKFSVLELAADVGRKKDGESVEVLFSGGGTAHVVKGEVHGTLAEYGVTGVILRPEHNDELWNVLTTKKVLDYVVPGYRANTLVVRNGRNQISDFLAACRSFQTALLPAKTTETKRAGAPSEISDKEAFDAAKDLNTTAAWEAFLNNYPTGFRSDLARAYVQQLGSGGNSQKPSESPANQPAAVPTAHTIQVGPGVNPWRNQKLRLAANLNKPVYSASVRAGGLELAAYCHASRKYGPKLTTVVRAFPKGARSASMQRLKAGLAAAPTDTTDLGNLRVTFSNGGELSRAAGSLSAKKDEMTIYSDRKLLSPGDDAVQDMMSAQTMTISAPPFAATFQLNGSRPALCSVFNRCGARTSGCARVETPAVVKKKRAKKKKKVAKKKRKKKRNLAPTKYDAKRGCRRNQRYVGGKCRNAANASQFCGPGYAPRNGKCTQGASYNF